jgi:tRNA(Ile)-lysidine synthase
MLLERFRNHLQEDHPGLLQVHNKWLITVSGGVDSIVLCDLAYNAGIDFILAHCNFQLRGEESDRDEHFVRSVGEKYGKEVLVKKFDTTRYAEENKKSVQVAARELRYKWFYEILNGQWSMVNEEVEENFPAEIIVKVARNPPKIIVTAHHANDNIETLLMNFFKGTGISGLHGILPFQNQLFRPLLVFKKEELVAYAKENQLSFVEDSSNASDKYTRNYFRQHIIPTLKEKYPHVEDNVMRNIERFNEVEQLYQQAIAFHKKKLLEYKASEVHIPVLKLQKVEPLRSIVYEIIKDFSFTAAQVDEVISLLESESGKFISSPSHRIIRNRRWLIISPKETTIAANIIIEVADKSVHFENGKLLIELREVNSEFTPPTSFNVCSMDSKDIRFPLLLRKWKQGDYFYPLGMKKKKKLSRFFIDKKLSKTDKEKVWVLEMNKKIVWVVGLRIDDRFKVEASTRNILHITWDK